jgi:hypothetical protein
MLPNSSYDAPSTLQDMATIYKMGPMIVVGSTKAQGSKAKPTSRVRVAQSNQSEGQSNTMGGQQLVHPTPHQGTRHPQASYLSPDQEISFTLLRVG